MARRRPDARVAAAAVDVREHLLVRYRRLDARFGRPAPGRDWHTSRYRDRVALLEAGETVDVYDWELPWPLRPAVRSEFGPRVAVLADGTLAPAGPVDLG